MAVDPVLQSFFDKFATDGGKGFAAEVAGRIQAHIDAQQVAQVSQQAHQEFIGKISSLKNNLSGMARKDPGSADLALDLSDITMRHLTDALGHTDENHNALLSDIQNSIAHSAIQGLADMHEGAARSALNSGRLADLISDDQRANLDRYIGVMADQRATDQQARQAEIVRQHINMSGKAATEWLSGMTDPTTGQAWFPDSWGQRMVQDERMSPHDRAGLQNAYRNLIANGNPAQSDPDVVHDLLNRAALPHNDPANPSIGEVISHAGRGLTLADAQMIAGRAGPQDPLTDQATSRISDVLDDARQQIDNPSAFGRFVNWLLPAVRSGASLDPSAKEFALTPERMQTFQPTGDDVISKVRESIDPANRPALGDIFANPHGFAMRSEPGADYRNKAQGVDAPGTSLGDFGRFVAGIPGAIADGAKLGWNNPSEEQMGANAYANPFPVQGPDGPNKPAPPRETMANMPGSE
jgi:hypothetical protein